MTTQRTPGTSSGPADTAVTLAESTPVVSTSTPSLTPKQTQGVIRGFFRIADIWLLSRKQRATLLAASERSIDRWSRPSGLAWLTRDQIERISYVLGIYGGLHAILGESPLANDWVRRPNSDFGDASPLDRMLAGNVGDLADVRRYVDAWRVGW